MKYFVTLMLLFLTMAAASNTAACCGSEYQNPSTVPPPPPGSNNITPAFSLNEQSFNVENTYNVTRTFSKEWARPFSITNDYGVYTFSTIGDKLYYQVETNGGAVFMDRY